LSRGRRVRPVEAADEAAWRRLWRGYCDFYQVTVAEDVTDKLWLRIMDERVPMCALVAETVSRHKEPQVIGFANYILHPYTWGTGLMCYLEDLFVAEESRCSGVGRSLIEALAGMARENGWARVYWHTHQHNDVARALYDKVTSVDPFVRYVIHLG
jgi:GNAT superfamily N-acetyltransferase